MEVCLASWSNFSSLPSSSCYPHVTRRQRNPTLLCTCSFLTITSDRKEYKNSSGTRNFLLDIAQSRRQRLRGDYYPTYIIEEFALLLCNIFEGPQAPIWTKQCECLYSSKGATLQGSSRIGCRGSSPRRKQSS